MLDGNELALQSLAVEMEWNGTGTTGIDGSPRHGLDGGSKQASAKSWTSGWTRGLIDSLPHHLITRDGRAWHGYGLPCSIWLVCMFCCLFTRSLGIWSL
jgi:hypothetical protein